MGNQGGRQGKNRADFSYKEGSHSAGKQGSEGGQCIAHHSAKGWKSGEKNFIQSKQARSENKSTLNSNFFSPKYIQHEFTNCNHHGNTCKSFSYCEQHSISEQWNDSIQVHLRWAGHQSAFED